MKLDRCDVAIDSWKICYFYLWSYRSRHNQAQVGHHRYLKIQEQIYYHIYQLPAKFLFSKVWLSIITVPISDMLH